MSNFQRTTWDRGYECGKADAERDRRCKFNCRTAKENWMAGFDAGHACAYHDADTCREDTYKEWKSETKTDL